MVTPHERPGLAHGPTLNHMQLVDMPSRTTDPADGMFQGVIPLGGQLHELAMHIGWHQDVVQDGRGFLDGAQHVSPS